MHSQSKKRYQKRNGVSIFIVIKMFAIMLIFSFFALNMANVQRHRVASQIASDLSARWGVDQLSRTTDIDQIEQEVKDLAYRNWTVAAQNDENWLQSNMDTIDVNVQFGSADLTSGSAIFSEGSSPFNSLRVTSTMSINSHGFLPKTPESLVISRASTVIALERDLCLVLDRSGSMTFDLNTGYWMYDYGYHSYNKMSTSSSSYLQYYSYQWWWHWPHPEKSRWSTMIPAVYGLAEELAETQQNEKFSIVSYSTGHGRSFYDHNMNWVTSYYDESETEQTPTFDYSTAVANFDNKYKYSKFVSGGTNISAGIDEAVDVLTGSSARPNAYKTMIVMTDGQYNQGRSPWLAAADAAEEGIQVHTVTFSHQADQYSMELTADAGNGQHFHAPDGEALEEIFREIANIPPAAYIE